MIIQEWPAWLDALWGFWAMIVGVGMVFWDRWIRNQSYSGILILAKLISHVFYVIFAGGFFTVGVLLFAFSLPPLYGVRPGDITVFWVTLGLSLAAAHIVSGFKAPPLIRM